MKLLKACYIVLLVFLSGCSNSPSESDISKAVGRWYLGDNRMSVSSVDIISQDKITDTTGVSFVTRAKIDAAAVEDLYSTVLSGDFTYVVSIDMKAGEHASGYFSITSKPYRDGYTHTVRNEDFRKPGITMAEATRKAGSKMLVDANSEDGKIFMGKLAKQVELLGRNPTKESEEQRVENKIDFNTLDSQATLYYAAFPVTNEWSPWFTVSRNRSMGTESSFLVKCTGGVRFQARPHFAFSLYTVGEREGQADLRALLRHDKVRGSIEKQLRMRHENSRAVCQVCSWKVSAEAQQKATCSKWNSNPLSAGAEDSERDGRSYAALWPLTASKGMAVDPLYGVAQVPEFTPKVLDNNPSVTASGQTTGQVARTEVPKVYGKKTVTVTGDWGTKITHSSDETIVVWGFEGLMFKSLRKDWAETPYTSGTKNLFGGSGANEIQFRVANGVEAVRYCIYPVGKNWREVCQ